MGVYEYVYEYVESALLVHVLVHANLTHPKQPVAIEDASVIPSPILIEARSLQQDGVLVFIRRRTAAQETQRQAARVADLMLRPRRDGDGVAGTDLAGLVAHLHPSRACQDIVDLLGSRVVVRGGCRPGGQASR